MEAIDLNAAYTAFANEGATLFAQGKHMAAFTCFWKAFRIRPGAPVNLFNLGRTMEQLKISTSLRRGRATLMLSTSLPLSTWPPGAQKRL